ncbi:hypothetical protein CNBM0070 [Cryptococcus deneoformans B-3501A]|uniref:hypothetical protein n=1 Tax=Cryptococcus deneoformans (strain B-3501A) TaxID=283643 RepID=UPI000042DAE2|nr:hypothetical protein CNBM0070 [Cryptococcus neoformans var. neoformans B-3501A]EAL17623.1 hypothetical protein CNBM0070 [Cryptococcus neoformans var. neoformans B-3501A]
MVPRVCIQIRQRRAKITTNCVWIIWRVPDKLMRCAIGSARCWEMWQLRLGLKTNVRVRIERDSEMIGNKTWSKRDVLETVGFSPLKFESRREKMLENLTLADFL